MAPPRANAKVPLIVPASALRGKAPVGPPKVLQPYTPVVKEPVTCPLCIETLDETDLSFNACPCGYRVCLFCVEQIKLHCRGLCPGCRREYGDSKDQPPAALNSSDGDTASTPRAAAAAPSRPPERHGGSPGASAQPGPSRAAAGAGGQGAKAGVATKRAAEPPQLTKRMEDLVTPALPSGATWATQNQARIQQQHEVERAATAAAATSATSAATAAAAAAPAPSMDESSWPSLATAAPPPPPPPPVQQARGPQPHTAANARNGGGGGNHAAAAASSNGTAADHAVDSHRRSVSMSLSSVDEQLRGSTQSLDQMSQDTQQPSEHHHNGGTCTPLPPHLAEAFSTAQVTAVAAGIRRPVNVPLHSGAHVEPLPEAPERVAAAHQSVKAGAVTAREAAAHLMAFLKQRGPDGGPAVRRAPPPGFGGPPMSMASAAVQPSTAQQQQQHQHQLPKPVLQAVVQPLTANTVQCPVAPLTADDHPVVPQPPLGRYQPIAPPIAPPGPAAAVGGSGSGNGAAAGSAAAQGPPPGFFGVGKTPVQPAVQLGGGGGLGAMQQQQGQQGMWSMWSGLPGISLGLNSSIQSVLWGGALATPSSLDGGSSSCSGLGHMGASAMGPALDPVYPTKAPPPGFGPQAFAAQANGDASKASPPLPAANGNGFRHLGAYNPLAQALQGTAQQQQRPPPPGITAPYRPQGLGA